MFDLVYPEMLINALINKHVLTCKHVLKMVYSCRNSYDSCHS